jgi:hypothetical protein
MKVLRILVWGTSLFAATALRYSPRGGSRRDVKGLLGPADEVNLPDVANVTLDIAATTDITATISDKAWEDLRIKGCNLLRAMAASDEEAAEFFPGREGSAESPFQGYPGK